jgi:hypothetical protein
LPKAALAKLREEVEMAKGLCPPFDPKAYREGHLTPVYFGSALTRENSTLIGTGDREFIGPLRARACVAQHVGEYHLWR